MPAKLQVRLLEVEPSQTQQPVVTACNLPVLCLNGFQQAATSHVAMGSDLIAFRICMQHQMILLRKKMLSAISYKELQNLCEPL
jgi:hypothetical protein